jgi:hypothetical protein
MPMLARVRDFIFARVKAAAPVAAVLALLVAAGCNTAPPMAPVTLSDAGWTVWNGQAIWRPVRSMPELTGDLTLAVNTNGAAFVQFSKTIPFAIARLEGKYWSIEFPPDHRKYSGHRPLPHHFAMLQLPAVARTNAVSRPWTESGGMDDWQIDNPRTGETLHGFLAPQ